MGIQYVIPVMLCYYGRKHVSKFANLSANPYKSFFRGTTWLIIVSVWAALCVVLVTLYLALVYFPGSGSSSPIQFAVDSLLVCFVENKPQGRLARFKYAQLILG